MTIKAAKKCHRQSRPYSRLGDAGCVVFMRSRTVRKGERKDHAATADEPVQRSVRFFDQAREGGARGCAMRNRGSKPKGAATRLGRGIAVLETAVMMGGCHDG